MITIHGWLPRCTAVTVQTSPGHWRVIIWQPFPSSRPAGDGQLDDHLLPLVRLRPTTNGPWCYESVRRLWTRSAVVEALS